RRTKQRRHRGNNYCGSIFHGYRSEKILLTKRDFSGTVIFLQNSCSSSILIWRNAENQKKPEKGQSFGSTMVSRELGEIFPSRTCFLPEGQATCTRSIFAPSGNAK